MLCEPFAIVWTGRRVAFVVALFLGSMVYAESDSNATFLCAAYGEQFAYDAKLNAIVWRDGTRVPFGLERPGLSIEQRLDTATLFDQMSIPYSRAWPTSPPSPGADPGRLRCEAFFRKLYGNTSREVQRNLVRVPWPAAGPKAFVVFTEINNANKALEAVGAEFAAMPDDVKHLVSRPDGTFNWRTIEGTKRRSPHSFGIAIDFKIPDIENQYWRWNASDNEATATEAEAKTPREANRLMKANGWGEAPSEPASSQSNYPTAVLQNQALLHVVETFERHGFIWGGKWYHYDLMHFEYRPELVSN